MVEVESRPSGDPLRLETKHKLQHHWMLDDLTAEEFSTFSTDAGCEQIDNLLLDIESQWSGVAKRDSNREAVRQIIAGESDKKLIILGPCSLDADTDYSELFNYVEEMQAKHQDVIFGVRLNGAKPRSRGGNTGLFLSTIAGRRRKQLDAYDAAFQRGLPIFTEITEVDQFGILAPYLSGAWLGARDMGSTALRTAMSATRLNVLVKNGTDGKLASSKDALEAISKGTAENQGSGVNLGFIAYSIVHEDGGPRPLRVGRGNPNVALVARGYDVREEVLRPDGTIEQVNTLSEEESLQKTFKHLGDMCLLAKVLNTVVILDGSHEVPEMLSLPKKKELGGRFLKVLKIFRSAVAEGKISNAEAIRGYLGEVSVNIGETDPNLELTKETKRELDNEFSEFVKMSNALAVAGVS